jgi:hypothetical protein
MDKSKYMYKHLFYQRCYAKKFFLILIRIPYFNDYRMSVMDGDYCRFPKEKTVQGLYIKVLIPLKEENM